MITANRIIQPWLWEQLSLESLKSRHYQQTKVIGRLLGDCINLLNRFEITFHIAERTSSLCHNQFVLYRFEFPNHFMSSTKIYFTTNFIVKNRTKNVPSKLPTFDINNRYALILGCNVTFNKARLTFQHYRGGRGEDWIFLEHCR